jgi:hypothetical protein
MALYTLVYLYFDGQLLAENTTVEVALDSDAPDVMTTVKEWCGITPAPILTTITANNVIPRTGAEYDFEKQMKARAEVELTVQESGSGKKLTTRGYVRNVSRSAGVGQTTAYNFTFKGTPATFE